MKNFRLSTLFLMAVLITSLVGGDVENSFAANDKDKKILIQARDTNAQPVDATGVIEWEVSDDEDDLLEVHTNPGGVAFGYVPFDVSEVEVTCENEEQSNSVEKELKANGTTVIRMMFDTDETNEDTDDANDELEIEVEVKDGIAKVEVEHGDEELEFEIDWIDEEDVIDEIVSRTDLTAEQIEEVITFEFEDTDDANEDQTELEELREENRALRQQITELTENLQNLELIIYEQIKVMLDTLESLRNQ